MANTPMQESGSAGPEAIAAQHKVTLHPGLPKLLRNTRRALHARPELGFRETETSRFLHALLQSRGMRILGPIARTGFYIDIVGNHPGPMVGYRADMDGLPVADAKHVPYKSKCEGVSHACGHDAHMAIGAGVALTLHRLRDKLHGTVRVFFQPNEEGTPSGSVSMIQDGVLNGLEAVYCVHVDPTLNVGTYGLRTGTVTASSDRFRVRLQSRGTGHSARPHKSTDTIWIATLLLQHFYQLIGRVTDARNPAVLTVCVFKAGTAYNVIPRDAEFEGSLRFLNNEDRAHTKRYMRRAVEQFAALHDLRITLDFPCSLPSAINDSRLVHHLHNTVRLLFSESAVQNIPVPSMGSEDFANYLEYVPGMLLRIGTQGSRHTSYPLHDANFDLDEAALAPTVQLMSTALISHLRQRVLEQAPLR